MAHILNRDVNVLVVDDFATMRKIVSNILKECGFTRIYEAEDGAVAWPMIQGGSIDFVVSDWNMPNMTGIELLQKVRAFPLTASMPFMLITAEQKRSQILEAAQAGVDGYVVKPFTSATLDEKIKKISVRKPIDKLR